MMKEYETPKNKNKKELKNIILNEDSNINIVIES